MTTKAARLERANAVIKAISDHGRRFFYHVDRHGVARVARLDEGVGGRLYLIDDYGGARVPMWGHVKWWKTSCGGTMQRIIEELLVYVRTGRKVRSGHFADKPSWLGGDQGNVWGYSREDYAAVRAAVIATGAVQAPAQQEAS